jgi:hypothetical protein
LNQLQRWAIDNADELSPEITGAEQHLEAVNA